MKTIARQSYWPLLAALGVCPAAAADFKSVADNAAVLYDAPSAKAKKLYVIGRQYPLEVIVAVEGWLKVRDATGELSWVEAKSLSERRTVMVKTKLAEVRQIASDDAPVAFRCEAGVLLDLNELSPAGWARVTHRDGQVGYIRVKELWGV